MNRPNSDEWIDTAARIGARIVEAAVWTGATCTWNVWSPTRAVLRAGPRAQWTPATADLYQGAAGIALFLTELYRHTGEQRVLKTAVGALRHARDVVHRPPSQSFSFHSGYIGLAFALYRFGVVTSDDRAFRDVEDLLRPFEKKAVGYPGLDVIVGAAGAIPPLLEMSDQIDKHLSLRLAIDLGNTLVRAARRDGVGWSWDGSQAAIRNLTGFAHGASGCAHALIELFGVTRDDWFAYGAEQAFAYERQFFDERLQNWPDFRHPELGEYLSAGESGALRDRILRGEPLADLTMAFSTAWCHGAPGMALARLRAAQVLGDVACATEAAAAAQTTLAQVRNQTQSYCLCHGHFGNAETLLLASRVLNRPEFRIAAEERASRARQEIELPGKPWPCGTIGGVSDPSFMVGEAGIGYFYLRLYDETTPSVLCLEPSSRIPHATESRRDAAELKRIEIDEHFGSTLQALARLRPNDSNPIDIRSLPRDATLTSAYDTIVTRIASESDAEVHALMVDAFVVDRARFALTRTAVDSARDFIDRLARPTAEEIGESRVVMRLAEHVTIVQPRNNWPGWQSLNLTSRPQGKPDAGACADEVATYTHKTSRHSTALVVSCATEPQRAGNADRDCRGHWDHHPELRPAVLEQLEHAAAGGLLKGRHLRQRWCSGPTPSELALPTRPTEGTGIS